MKRIAAPMIGGIFTSFLLELVVYPAIYEVWKWRSVKAAIGLILSCAAWAQQFEVKHEPLAQVLRGHANDR